MSAKSVILVYSFLISSCFSSHNNVEVATSEAALDHNGQLLLKWKVDYAIQKIRFEININERAPPFTWFAFGFSDRGELTNADVCLFWTDYYAASHYEDMHSNSSGNLKRDAQQDCEMFYYEPTTRIITFERLFDTCDSNDYLIEDGTVHMVWARGNKLLAASDELCLNCVDTQDHGLLRARLLVPVNTPRLGEAQLVAITAGNYRLGDATTTYMCRIIRRPEFLDEKGYHIVQYDGTVTPGNEHMVHHMKVIYCDADPEVEMPLYQGLCSERPAITSSCTMEKATWAYGASPFIYPEEAGMAIGGPNTNKYLMLQIHYNNEHLTNDVVDNSGIILHIGERRQNDAALMSIGVHYTDRMAIPPGQKAFTWSGYCVPECTGVALPPAGITVFASQLHTHLTGRAIWTRHVRHGVELPPLDKDMHYSTNYQEIRMLRRPVTVLPGDFLKTTCVYNTEDRVNVTIGGDSTMDEMCTNYLHYYPATDLESCKSSVSPFYLRNYFNFERRWYNISIDPYDSPRKNYQAIGPWDLNRVETLRSLYTEFPIATECNRTGGKFPGEWNDQTIPTILLRYPKMPRMCPKSFKGLF